MAVEIKSHPVWVGYGSSRDGRIWSRCPLNGRGPMVDEWREVRLRRDYLGRMSFTACGDGKRKTVLAHRIVLECWICMCPAGLQCCHGNGDPSDNRVANLRWDTAKSNQADSKRHGTRVDNRGERCGTSKLTEAQVLEIRARVAAGEVQQAVADRYGVCGPLVCMIANRKRWAHIR